jgi:hypothetical membrane protein
MTEHVAGVSENNRTESGAAFRLKQIPVRQLAWLAIAGQVAFIAAWIVASALQPGYSPIDQAISELGARNAAHPWIVNTGIVILGVAVAALGPCVLAVLPARRATRIAAAGFVVSGVAIALAAAFPIDCSLTVDRVCIARFHAGELSWQTTAHVWLGPVFDVAFVATPFALARVLWPSPVAAASLASGLFGIGFWVVSFAAIEGAGVADGLGQRIGFIPVHLWVVIVAAGVLHTLRSREDAGVLVPIRPRDFFGRAWAGRGEVTLYPGFVWRRFPLRVDFRREAQQLGEESWTFTDTTTFTNGFEFVRRMVCVMEAPDRVKVIAEDMPGGAELVLTEGGFRVRPYRFTYPVGPIGLTVSCHDRVRDLGDGSLDWTIAFRWHGLPVSQISGRVRPV